MIDLLDVAIELQEFCDSQDWRYCFIGGVAVQRWSEVRVTRDVDLTLLTGFGKEDLYIDALLTRFAARGANAAQLARSRRVLLLCSSTGIGIDVSLGALPFEELAVAHATPHEYAPGVILRTCSAEDLVVMKLFASRPLDIRDAEGVALRHGKELDWRYVEEQLAPLVELKEEPEIMQTLARIRRLS